MYLLDDRQTDAIPGDGCTPARFLWIVMVTATATAAQSADGGDGPRACEFGRPRGYEQPPAGDAGPQWHANTASLDESPNVRDAANVVASRRPCQSHVQWRRPLPAGHSEPPRARARASVQW